MIRLIRRGDIYRISFGDGKGHELEGPHYAVVVQSDVYQALSTTVVLPISTSVKMKAPFHVPIKIEGKNGFVLINQARVVDVEKRLREFVANISETNTMAHIGRELLLLLGFDRFVEFR